MRVWRIGGGTGSGFGKTNGGSSRTAMRRLKKTNGERCIGTKARRCGGESRRRAKKMAGETLTLLSLGTTMSGETARTGSHGRLQKTSSGASLRWRSWRGHGDARGSSQSTLGAYGRLLDCTRPTDNSSLQSVLDLGADVARGQYDADNRAVLPKSPRRTFNAQLGRHRHVGASQSPLGELVCEADWICRARSPTPSASLR